MPKNKASSKDGENKEKANSEISIETSTISDELPVVKTIEITINTIENVVRKDKTYLLFSVEHNGVVLGESNRVEIEPDFADPPTVYEVNFTIQLPITVNDRSSIDSIVSTPVLIKAAEDDVNDDHRHSTSSSIDKKRISQSNAKSSTTTAITIGICYIDLMSIILGETSVTDKYRLQMVKPYDDVPKVSWQNLPLVTINMKRNEFFLPYEEINFLTITVESIYNLPAYFTEESEYKAGTIVYVDRDIPETVIFEDGKWMKYHDVDRKKRWNTLFAVESRAKCSEYALNSDWANLNNPFKKNINFEKKVLEDSPRIEWNSMHRCILLSQGSSVMQQCISKYRYWPFQLAVTNKIATNSKVKSKYTSTVKGHFYQCYVDLTELLFPGNTKTRVVVQLHVYSEVEMLDKTGFNQNIITLNAQRKESSEGGRKLTDSENVQFEGQTTSDTAIFGQNGLPVVIIIEVELHYPLIASQISTDFSSLLDEIIVPIEKRRPYAYSGDLAEEQYSSCIKQLVDIIVQSYQDYRGEISKMHCNPLMCKAKLTKDGETCKYCFNVNSDELTCFTQYLHKTGTYLAIYSTLKSKVTLLLDQKFHIQPTHLDSVEAQNFITKIYTYLVGQMHTIVNEMVEGREVNASPDVTLEKLYYYAEEAYELGYTNEANNYFTTAIASNNTNADTWTRYAIFLLRINNVDRAMEACREAISLDRRHRLALLMYGGILVEKREYREAEIFFRSIVEFYPRFIEGWTVLHLFYIRTEYYPGMDLTFRVAQKCMDDVTQDTENLEEPLSWTTILSPTDSIYALTTSLLLKLHLCDLAGIALAKEMSSSEKSAHILYYLAVQHYLTGRYEDALSHLDTLKDSYGLDYSISGLAGHCYFQRGDSEQAMRYYEFADMVFNKPSDMHLIHLRMGIYLEDIGEYERAKKVLLSVCKSSPTFRTWLYAGITFYHLHQLKEAEMALLQANNINNQDPDVWGYLCLLNMSLMRYDEFAQCYRQAVKNNLKNVKLWMMISDCMEALNYTCPILTESVEEDLIVEDVQQTRTLELG